MRIAVIEHADGGDYTEYIFSLLKEKAALLGYQIKQWSNSVPVSQQRIAENAIVFISVDSNTSFFLNWLYRVKIPSVIKKIKADVVIDLNGIASPKIKIPQVITANPLLFVNDSAQLNKIGIFALKHLKHSQKIAAAILNYSTSTTQSGLLTDQEKLQHLPFTAPEIFKPFEWHEKILIKSQFADNKEYFISIIGDESLDDFIMLLKGFSRFKKWQQSSMQLLILPKYESFSSAIKEKLKTYKYNDDVQLLEDGEEKEIASLFASAHSLIHISGALPQLLILSIAVQCSLPVISFDNEDAKEYCADSVLLCAKKTDEALGNSLIELYKNESLHAQLKEAANKQSLNLKRTEYSDKLWQLLEVKIKK